ncbi:tape measure protein [Pseudomonas fulva]|uniref:tape measure protein n=1 Tax=Pseudomonas fulva TaxID=47880 RepID=UPI00201DC816|nr:tape measure protein [Pseudomonas fulva]UQY33601.1 tape measure protein [Pseudomonas fulva]
MTDVELRLTADTAGAEKGIAGFRKEYVELVRAIEKPLRQIDALQKAQESAKKASTEFFAAKNRVDQLRTAMESAGQPVKDLERELLAAERALAKSTRAFDVQKERVKAQRAELRAAGIDYRNLAAEQTRLQGALAGAMGKGQADATISRALDTFGVNKLRELRAQLVQLRSDYARLSQSGQMAATERIAAEISYQASLRRTQQQIQALTTADAGGGSGGIAAITARLAAITAAAYTVQRVAGFYFNAADAVGELEDRMRNALPVQEDYERSQARLEDISRRVRIPIAQAGELFLGAIGPLRDLGFTAAQTTDLVGALTAGLVANSVKGEKAASVIDQISKSLQTGAINTDALSSIVKNSPALTDALVRGLGKSRDELQRMASTGELTADKFVTALSGQSDALLKLADNMRVTGADAAGTFSQSIEKLIGSIDKITGASAAATAGLDKISDSISDLADGKSQKALNLLNSFAITAGKQLGTLLPGAGAIANLADGYQQYSAQAVSAIEDVTAAEELGRTESERINEQRGEEQRAWAAKFNESIQNDLVNPFKTALNDQVAAQNRANSKLRKAQEEQIATQKRYSDALNKLRNGATGPATFGNAQDLRVAARRALTDGDFKRAKEYAQQSLDMLMKIAEEGGNTYGFAGLIKGLQAIEEQADKSLVATADAERTAQIEKVRAWKKEFEELKNFKIAPTIDDAALAEATAKMKRWSDMIGKSFTFSPFSSSTTPAAKAPEGWRPPMALPTPGASPAGKPATTPSTVSVTKPSTTPTVQAVIEPVAIQKPKTPTLVALEVPANPNWIREGNSYRQKPLDVDAKPKWVRDGNSYTDRPVDVEAKPKWVRNGNSYTDAPVEVDVVAKKVATPEGEPLKVPALLQPLPPAVDTPPVEVKSAVDTESLAAVTQQFGAFITELAKGAVVPLRTTLLGPDTGPLPQYATGGILRGPGTGTSDSILARLSNGEGVINARAVRHYGPSLVHQINRLQLPAYATGGVLDMSGMGIPDIPTPSPELLARAAGPEHLGSLDLTLGGETHTVYVDRQQRDGLARLARKFGGTSRS